MITISAVDFQFAQCACNQHFGTIKFLPSQKCNLWISNNSSLFRWSFIGDWNLEGLSFGFVFGNLNFNIFYSLFTRDFYSRLNYIPSSLSWNNNFEVFSRMLIDTLSAVTHWILNSIGVSLNLLLVYLVIYKSPKSIKRYSLLILNFAITDLTSCLLDLFIQDR